MLRILHGPHDGGAQVCLAPDDLYVIIPTPPHPTLWSYLCSSLSCSWPVRYHHHPTPPHLLVLCMLKSVLLLTCTLSSPPHPTPPHPCRYNWAQMLDFVGTNKTNTCRYKWVKSVGASEPLPHGTPSRVISPHLPMSKAIYRDPTSPHWSYELWKKHLVDPWTEVSEAEANLRTGGLRLGGFLLVRSFPTLKSMGLEIPDPCGNTYPNPTFRVHQVFWRFCWCLWRIVF